MKTSGITIVGAGIAGCFLALLLAKKGHKVTIYEKLSQKEIVTTATKRSFNLTLYGFGVSVLKKTGLWEQVKPYMLPLQRTVTYVGQSTHPVVTRINQKEMPYFTLQRSELLTVLLQAALHHPNISFRFQTRLLFIDKEKKTLLLAETKRKTINSVKCTVVIGADGVHSAVRGLLQAGQPTNHQVEYASWTYKQFTISRRTAVKMSLAKATTYTWTQKVAVISVFPAQDGSYNAMLILPKTKEHGFRALSTAAAIEEKILTLFPNLSPALREIIFHLLKNPEGRFVMVRTSPWYYRDFMVLIGDAAHGFFPFFGQGISAAFGDCLELVSLSERYGLDWGKVFADFEHNRKRHMDTLGELSQQGFMRYRRHKRADYAIIYEKLEAVLYKLFPNYVLPPLFLPIARNPSNTADHVRNQQKQQRRFNMLGLSLFAFLLTGAIAAKERVTAVTIMLALRGNIRLLRVKRLWMF